VVAAESLGCAPSLRIDQDAVAGQRNLPDHVAAGFGLVVGHPGPPASAVSRNGRNRLRESSAAREVRLR
jgi:hypothetical protein